ncbi:hypothetical protein BGZ65_008631 [Modicella reniformis]|uniref:Uncharacterized protein n=1 Tax=Modicella reniformis TaxID=1440133 RepID=A0A9P6MEQ2_9FUNG|nr:hypothetical protein BGZ65_008631 [Modicella reniformis]
MVLSAIWTLAFGAHNPLPEFPDEGPLDNTREDILTQDHHHNNNNNNNNNTNNNNDNNDSTIINDISNDIEANIAKIHERQRDVIEAEHDILGTTVYLPTPSVRDESAENKTSFILVVTSLTLNNIGCYPFFGFRDRHQIDLE